MIIKFSMDGMNNQEREYGVDIMRIFAMMLVVIGHIVGVGETV